MLLGDHFVKNITVFCATKKVYQRFAKIYGMHITIAKKILINIK